MLVGWWTAPWLGSGALAQEASEGFEAHGFQLAPHDGDLRDPIVLQRPGALAGGDWFAGGLLEYAKAPLVRVTEPSGGGPAEVEPVVDNLLVANLSLGVAVHERVRFDLAAPIAGLSTGLDQASQGPAMGDLRLGATVLLASPDPAGGGAGFGLFGHLDVPTGSASRFLGRGGVAGGADLAATAEVRSATLTGHVGAQLDPGVTASNVTGGARVVAGAAVGILASESVGVTLEAVARPALTAGDPRFPTQPPTEAILSARVSSPGGAYFTLGGAAGITDGPGVAAFRLLVGGGWGARSETGPPDTDPLGELRSQDACPTEAETPNGWRDDDGCPDQLSALQVEARYAGAPRAASADLTGPTGRNTVRVPAEGYAVDAVPGTSWQVVATDGCLRGEASGVVSESGTVLSVALAPVRDARVTFEVVGVDDAPVPGAVARWTGPRQECAPPEGAKGGADGLLAQEVSSGGWRVAVTAEGYKVAEQDLELLPGDDRSVRVELGKSLVVFERERIRILEKVQFETGKSTIRPESFALLDQVAEVIRANPDVGRIEVGGHTDDEGSDSYNQRLSEGRAKAVATYLQGKGIPAARLVAVGYGEARPIAANRTDAGREANRRVEFNLIDQAAAPAPPTGGTP